MFGLYRYDLLDRPDDKLRSLLYNQRFGLPRSHGLTPTQAVILPLLSDLVATCLVSLPLLLFYTGHYTLLPPLSSVIIYVMSQLLRHFTQPTGLLRIYGFSLFITIAIWILVGLNLGLSAFITVVILTLLEVTFSFDNAVINSRILNTLSKFWQTLFLTVGIILAVFVVRFFVPILIVAITAGLGLGEVIDLALNDQERYSEELHESAHMIDAFGGTFLLLVGASFFIDAGKKLHWLKRIERPLANAGKIPSFTILTMILMTAAIYIGNLHRYSSEERNAILLAGIVAITLHVLMQVFDKISNSQQSSTVKHKVGMAAFISFMYLQLLDASFSLDGVIGAFAITSSVVLIAAGLGAGAVWVRSMTIHLVRAGTLAKYKFLEHGAHWAIMVLGAIMLIRLYGIELPEWATGSVGLVFIVLSIFSSVKRTKTQTN